MIITVVGGTGYVGLTTAACLAYKGHKVYCVGRSGEKIRMINQGIPVIFEEGLQEILEVATKEKKLVATRDFETSISDSLMIFICAGTPSRKDGSIDLGEVKNVCERIGRSLHNKRGYCIVIVKSTVVPSTTETIVIPLIERFSGKRAGFDFGVCMNPEFLREGSAVKDFLFPKEQGIVVGELDPKSGDGLVDLYKDFEVEILRTTIRTAEMIKYARNSYLAKDISFSNEIANLCQKLGIDYLDVRRGLEMDSRIGKGRFLNAGIGFGGSCFTKDLKALVAKTKEVGVRPKMLEATLKVNENQPNVIVDLATRALGEIEGKDIAVLGLAFKPGTDDMREARSIPVIKMLLSRGAEVYAFDPQAVQTAKEIFKNRIHYARSAEEALEKADACIIATEWPTFSNPKLYDSLRGRFVLDGRRSLNPKMLSSRLVYCGIGCPEGSS
jgi:UDPglucose 6-dehydrogenase